MNLLVAEPTFSISKHYSIQQPAWPMAMLPFNMVSPEEYLGEADLPGNGIKGEALHHGFIEVFA